MQEAGAWLNGALGWMAEHPAHRARAEALAVQSRHLAAQVDAATPERQRKELSGRSAGAAREARALVEAQAASFGRAEDRAAYVAHHEATRLLGG